MIDAKDLNSTIVRIVSILTDSKIKFHLTGGLASSFYGEPRFTQDIDIVIRISPGQTLDSLVAALTNNFIIDPQTLKEAVDRQGLFQALDEETMIKVDFHVGEAVPGELERSIVREIFPGVQAPLVTIEDSILSKLIWIKKGSHKSRQDIKMMLKRKEPIDFNYLEEQAIKLNLSPLLEELQAELKTDPQ